MTHGFCDLEELLLLATVLFKDGIKIDVFGVTALNLGSFCLGLFLPFAGLFGCLFSLRMYVGGQ